NVSSVCHVQDITAVHELLPCLNCQGFRGSVKNLFSKTYFYRNIFLGETFSSYISVHNDSSQLVREIAIKADLQTSSQRLNLSGGTSMPVHELPPSCCIDDVIHHEVKELGTHIRVAYTAGDKKKQLQMVCKGCKDLLVIFFSFSCETSNYYSPNPQSEEVFLEAQIQNITSSPMCMEHVSLEPSQMYSVIELNKLIMETVGTIYGKIRYLGPNETRQYLYRLRALPKALGRTGGVRGISAIGKLDIVWRTNLGERGRLQTSQLQRVAPGYGDVHLQLESIPDTVDIEAPFSVDCKVTNCSERTMGLHLELCNSHDVHWCGVSGRDLGTLPANGSLLVNLSLLACAPGLQVRFLCTTSTAWRADVAEITVAGNKETTAFICSDITVASAKRAAFRR
uniref:Trafficking protein particle complex subunit 13 n=1 Tax=Eptatretus burgeri TaxID=7764 RepID=A0A8C4QSG4_EPTBU